MRLIPGSPIARLLDACLVIGPLAYLFLDVTYVARGWWDPDTGALHLVVAVAIGLAGLRLVTLTDGWWQAVLAVVLVAGVVGDAGVGVDTMATGLGGVNLFDADGPANLFKTMGFFHPLTLLLAAVALGRAVPGWTRGLLGLGALAFPVAHVANIGWLAVTDDVVVAVALGGVLAAVRGLQGRASGRAAVV